MKLPAGLDSAVGLDIVGPVAEEPVMSTAVLSLMNLGVAAAHRHRQTFASSRFFAEMALFPSHYQPTGVMNRHAPTERRKD
jgi:hypothetical protein